MTSELIDPGTGAQLAPTSTDLVQRYQGAVMNTFGTPRRVFVRGEGCWIWDAEGNRYLDLLAGIAVNGLGQAHPHVLAAITSQLATLGHVSNFFATPAQVRLAERLVELVAGPGGEGKVFLANSGTEANEAAFKLCRRTGRTRMVAMEGGFHGRSMGALALTHKAAYREPFEPLPGEVTWVPFGDAEALAAAVDDSVAAVLIEPVQGEVGIRVAPEGFLARAREITREHGALLWFDEVQSGMGRTGRWLASQYAGVVPDVVTLAKGLGNGFPIGACIGVGPAGELLQPGAHGSTFGGNPVAAIAALAVLQVMERDGLLEHAHRAGEHLAASVRRLDHPRIAEVRGLGLLRAIELTEPIAAACVEAALDEGFVINATGPTTIRLLPPLVITEEQLDGFVAALPTIIERAGGQHS